jgi:CO/xanthine dehydrogenase Mo-binding subunit
MSLIGASVSRADAVPKVTGEAVYGVDVRLPRMVHGRLLRSPLPAGRIIRLDVEAARDLPGVLAVCTADDAPSHPTGLAVHDQRMFARDVVRFEGEPIAAVAAKTTAAAREAVEAIRLEIEPWEPIGAVEQAMDPDSRLVHPQWESYEVAEGLEFRRAGNIAAEMLSDPDGVDAAFARAHLVVEDEFRAPRQYQAYFEPKNAVVSYEGGRYTVYTAHQYPFNVRDRMAHILGVAPSRIRVICPTIGGGFGAKLDVGLEPYAGLLSRLIGLPVRIVNDRLEDMLTCTSREDAIIRIRSAVDQDGRILGRELTCLMNCGAYAGDLPFLASIPLHLAGSVYRVGTARVTTQVMYTNTAPTGAFRGVGGTYLTFAIERHMDHIAGELGIDRRDLRLRNLFKDGDRMLTGQVIEHAGTLREAFDRIEEAAPWVEVTAAQPLHGVGLAALIWLTNPLPGSATLKLNEDGTLGVITAATENGSGAVAMGLTQIAAEELGLQPEDVIVLAPDTDAAAYDAGSQGSRTTHVVGRAIGQAATRIRERILEVASEMMEVSSADLELADGLVRVVGDPGSRLTLAEIARAATFTTGPISATGAYRTPMPSYDPTCASGLLFPAFPTPTFHVHLAEVEVDPVTGRIHVVRYVVVQDVGKAINPVGVRGQIQGGVAQGLGYALYEELDFDDARYRQRSLETYRLPTALDIPRVEVVLIENGDPDGPHGAKGVAEPPIVPVAAAVANAVSDAVGAPFDRLPVTPEDVLAALQERGYSR